MKHSDTRFDDLFALACQDDEAAIHDLHAEYAFDFQPLEVIAPQISNDWKDRSNQTNEEK